MKTTKKDECSYSFSNAIRTLAMMTEAGLTEELKNADPLQWVGTMNAITAQIEEILLAELVYS